MNSYFSKQATNMPPKGGILVATYHVLKTKNDMHLLSINTLFDRIHYADLRNAAILPISLSKPQDISVMPCSSIIML